MDKEVEQRLAEIKKIATKEDYDAINRLIENYFDAFSHSVIPQRKPSLSQKLNELCNDFSRFNFKQLLPLNVENNLSFLQELEKEWVNKKNMVDEKSAYRHICRSTSASGQITYSFLTPWLALNKENYEKYQKLGNWTRREKLMENILSGNIISISKTLGYTVPAFIETHIIKMKEIKTSLKGVPLLGFVGNFSVHPVRSPRTGCKFHQGQKLRKSSKFLTVNHEFSNRVNFEIPDYWGIGKSVSRGFGTVIRIEEQRTIESKSIAP